MTPANREELVGMLTRGFATSGVAFWTDATTGELLDALDATGLAIVPRWSLRRPVVYGTLQGITTTLSRANCYRAMLEASPYRGKDEKTAR
jgi:hypothetical protein